MKDAKEGRKEVKVKTKKTKKEGRKKRITEDKKGR